MGMEAQLIAIGPFRKALADNCNLDYAYSLDKTAYANIPEGTTIAATITSVCSNESSFALAEALGIKPWDFDTHVFKMDLGNWAPGRLEDCMGADYTTRVYRDIKALAEAGWTFIYLPNG